MWFLLGTHVNLCFWEMTQCRWKEATCNTRAVVLVAVPRKCTRWPHKHYGKSSLSKSLLRPFLFQKHMRSVWIQHSERKDLKISTLGLDFGTPCGLWDTTTWGPTVGKLLSADFSPRVLFFGFVYELQERTRALALWFSASSLDSRAWTMDFRGSGMHFRFALLT